jgi:hypothetical protein
VLNSLDPEQELEPEPEPKLFQSTVGTGTRWASESVSEPRKARSAHDKRKKILKVCHFLKSRTFGLHGWRHLLPYRIFKFLREFEEEIFCIFGRQK